MLVACLNPIVPPHTTTHHRPLNLHPLTHSSQATTGRSGCCCRRCKPGGKGDHHKQPLHPFAAAMPSAGAAARTPVATALASMSRALEKRARIGKLRKLPDTVRFWPLSRLHSPLLLSRQRQLTLPPLTPPHPLTYRRDLWARPTLQATIIWVWHAALN